MAPLVLLLVLLLALASPQPCRANTFGYCGPLVASNMYDGCKAHLTTPAVTRPDFTCCWSLDTHTSVYGAACYCEIYSQWKADPSSLGIDLDRAYALPRACNLVAVDMTNCAPPNAVAPPNAAAPPPPPVLSRPSPLVFPPPLRNFFPPPGSVSIPAPPTGFTPPTLSTSESSGSSSNSLPFPIVATAGGVGGGALVIAFVWLLLSRLRIHLQWDLNAPCWCCYRKPKPQPHDVHGDKVPAKYGM